MNSLTWNKKLSVIWHLPWIISCPLPVAYQSYQNTSSPSTQWCGQLPGVCTQGSLCLSCLPRASMASKILLHASMPSSTASSLGTRSQSCSERQVFPFILCHRPYWKVQHPVQCTASSLRHVKSFGWMKEWNGTFSQFPISKIHPCGYTLNAN